VSAVCRLVVLAKEPRPGKVKTRLCPPFSPDHAAALAAAALADTFSAVRGAVTEAARHDIAVQPVLVLDGSTGEWLDEAWGIGGLPPVLAQRDGGLDERIAGAFEDASVARQPTILIGMDTPQVGAERLLRAMQELLRPGCDAVFGRAFDGGWWSLGMAEADPDLVRGIPTSTSFTGRRQLNRLVRAGLRVSLLDSLRDVDTVADADEAAALVPGGRFAATLAQCRPRVASA
jgi:uncharacterized protein